MFDISKVSFCCFYKYIEQRRYDFKVVFDDLGTAPSVNIRQNYYALNIEYQFLLNILLKYDHLSVEVVFQKN